jgi:hypothetical protein
LQELLENIEESGSSVIESLARFLFQQLILAVSGYE